MGGEPFLHHNLIDFCLKLVLRYKRPLFITTNGFWLSEENIRLYKDLWPIVQGLKISRYPSIEKRLGGEACILQLIKKIKQYNPKIYVEWPNKYAFNELKFFDEPVEPEIYCFNVNCVALLTDLRLGHCGAGAYQHLAPAGTFSRPFLESKDMFYDLTQFKKDSFVLWYKRYPLDACRFCNLSQKMRSTAWRPLKGAGLFKREYEYTYERNQCLMQDTLGEYKAVDLRISKFLDAHPDAANVLLQVANQRFAAGELEQALELTSIIAGKSPENKAVQEMLLHFARSLKVAPSIKKAAQHVKSQAKSG